MERLSVTMIDVGWGDSILVEAWDSQDRCHYGLIDSNDTTYMRSSLIFLKRHFEKNNVKVDPQKPLFDFVLLTHSHTDHGQGLKAIMKAYGTRRFWYPKSSQWGSQAYLIKYANQSKKVVQHEAVDTSRNPYFIGGVKVSFLWPAYGYIDKKNENNNSVVLALTLGGVSMMLTGDAEEVAWQNMANQIPANTKFFKVPHHGSINGTFDQHGNETWPAIFSWQPTLGISSHVKPFKHPDQQVINLFSQKNWPCYRTDESYHLAFTTDGTDLKVKYSHF